MNSKRVVCIGNGLAALNFALHIDDHTEMLLITPGGFHMSNSYMAKGGIAIPSKDDIEQHIRDTLIAGDGMCDPMVVSDIILSSQSLISDLNQKGFFFDQTVGKEGGHSHNRIRHVGDETGKHLTRHIAILVEQKKNVQVLHDHVILELWVEDNICKGALIGNKQNNTLEWLSADAVVLATGGCGNLYLHHSNSINANGEGYAIAYRAGAMLSGLEFMQFHPTMLFPDAGCGNFLVTEALRGAGATLKDSGLYEIMSGVHPMGSLAPRDIVSRTISRHLESHKESHVWLDFGNIGHEVFEKEFPALYTICRQHGFLGSRMIPVIPAAHYMCGGIKTNLQGETTVSGLYALGEVAGTGLHGANRLASNSLLELMILSERAAGKINMMETKGQNRPQKVERLKGNTNDHFGSIHAEMQTILWSCAGILRDGKKLEDGMVKLMDLLDKVADRQQNQYADIQLTQTQNRLQTALLIMECASAREESRGCHFRTDMPMKSAIKIHSDISIGDGSEVTFTHYENPARHNRSLFHKV